MSVGFARTVLHDAGRPPARPRPTASSNRASLGARGRGWPRVAEWWRQCGPRRGHLGGKTEVPQDALRHGGLPDERDQPPRPDRAPCGPACAAEREANEYGQLN